MLPVHDALISSAVPDIRLSDANRGAWPVAVSA
jgi:hypothetical protein